MLAEHFWLETGRISPASKICPTLSDEIVLLLPVMTKPPPFVRLDWDDWNRDHISKHGVLPEEAGEILSGNAMVRRTYKQRLQLVGPTLAGRMLSVIIGVVPDQPGAYYVFSARPASRKERALYRETRGGAVS